MRKSDLILPWAAVLLSACAQQSAGYPAARAPYPDQQFSYPVQRQDPLRDTSQQLYSVEQILRQLQNLQSTVSRF